MLNSQRTHYERSTPPRTHHRSQVGPYQNSSSSFLPHVPWWCAVDHVYSGVWEILHHLTPHSCFSHSTGVSAAAPLPHYPLLRRNMYIFYLISRLWLIIFTTFGGVHRLFGCPLLPYKSTTIYFITNKGFQWIRCLSVGFISQSYLLALQQAPLKGGENERFEHAAASHCVQLFSEASVYMKKPTYSR